MRQNLSHLNLLSVEQKCWIVFQVTHVDFCSELLHIRMLLDEQPAAVREEKAALRVVRVGVGVCELVVNSMISNPLYDVLLRRQRLQEDKKVFEGGVGSVRAMCEVSVRAGGDSEGSAEQDYELEEIGETFVWQIEETVNCGNV